MPSIWIFLLPITSRSDLSGRGNDSMYDNLKQAWAFYQQRDSKSPKIEFLHFDSGDEGKGEGGIKGQRSGTRILVLQNDMPFLVDSICQALMRCSVIVRYINNSVLYNERNVRGSKAAGKLSIIPLNVTEGSTREALICLDCVRLTANESKLAEKEVRETLKHVAAVVKDYPAMCKQMLSVRAALEMSAAAVPASPASHNESLEFISWMLDDHFTFLGCEKYCVNRKARSPSIELQENLFWVFPSLRQTSSRKLSCPTYPWACAI